MNRDVPTLPLWFGRVYLFKEYRQIFTGFIPKVAGIASNTYRGRLIYCRYIPRISVAFSSDEVAEWLRRWTANPMCSARFRFRTGIAFRLHLNERIRLINKFPYASVSRDFLSAFRAGGNGEKKQKSFNREENKGSFSPQTRNAAVMRHCIFHECEWTSRRVTRELRPRAGQARACSSPRLSMAES
ncbi:hypothetical protein EVAR_79480_1 [Eumeta japonica]|uniref:Uncharacterized protein n=1 Tax=Eumeta variegata TaxID=151549 RepID=A0A4C1UDP5_EUMVA|nr:hypothetical protein EVAR_79480_1 [Eumeta japonica]